jgi:hypothetical protein
VSGKLAAQAQVEGDLAGWSDDYRLILVNEHTNDRAWRGELHLIAVYSRALSAEEVSQNFAAGEPGRIDYAALLPPPAERAIDFVKDVQPIFRKHCFECHAQGNEEGGLNLGIRQRVLEGGGSGPVLIRGDSAHSRLVHLAAGVRKDEVMPPEGEGERLSKEEVGIVRAWIDQGANWPNGADVLDPRTEKARSHWAFQPLAKIDPPEVKDAAWCCTPIDRFILAALEARGLSPTPPTPPRKLVRRMYYDVIGLPPTPEESAKTSVAIDEIADRLLASRHYGERWGRHWLDVSRYADSDGQEGDTDRPGAYHYRDFVIRALNEDMPWNQMVRWQLAGDEYEPNNAAAVAATGFLVAGTHTVLENTFLEEERLRNRYNELDDMVATIGSGMLGLTIGCARCHDHKYDAISAREYYRMLAAVHGGDRAEVSVAGASDKILAFRDFGGEPAPTWLFPRADFYKRDQRVELGFLTVLSKDKTPQEYWTQARQNAPRADTTYQRKALAQWMTDEEQGAAPLVSRVIVNRVWQHHFGQGLVRTPGDFGVRSEAPTHPELLEWLAQDFVAGGWKLKRLHKLILRSSVYQQDVTFDAAKAKVDPENRLLWRMRPRRLEAEILRDAMLATSGTLNLEPYGPAFRPAIIKEANVARNLKTPYPDDAQDSPATRRRSVYMFHKRVVPYPLLAAFDRPDALQSCSRRESTTVAPQALALLNDGYVRNWAGEFAARLIKERGADDAQCIARAFELALARGPSESEQTAAAEFLQSQAKRRRERNQETPDEEIRRLALTDFCQALFALNEFLYVD